MTGEHDEFDRVLGQAMTHRPVPIAPADLADRAIALYAADVREADLRMARVLRLRRRNWALSIAASVLISLIVLVGVWQLAGAGENSLVTWGSASSAQTAASQTTASQTTSDSSLTTGDNALIQPIFLLAAAGLVSAVLLLSAASSLMEMSSIGSSELVLN